MVDPSPKSAHWPGEDHPLFQVPFVCLGLVFGFNHGMCHIRTANTVSFLLHRLMFLPSVAQTSSQLVQPTCGYPPDTRAHAASPEVVFLAGLAVRTGRAWDTCGSSSPVSGTKLQLRTSHVKKHKGVALDIGWTFC